MEYLSLIGTVILIHFFAVLSPGPDFIMSVKNSLTYSCTTGIWTAVGLGCGIIVHIIYCLAGLAVVISQSIPVFNTIKLFGAMYLIYVGIMSMMSTSKRIEISKDSSKKDLSPLSAVQMGFFTNVLNPKATLFF